MGNDVMALRRRFMAARPSGGLLPAAYQQVEWIASDGTAFIKSGYTPSINISRVTWRYELTGTYTGDEMMFGYTRSAITDTRISVELYDRSRWYNNIGQSAFSNVLKNCGTNLNTIYDGDMTLETLTIDGNSVNITGTRSNIGGDREVYIFAWNHTNGTAQYINQYVRLYRITIYESGAPAADFVPCYRKSDNEIGMYDIVSQTFHGNAAASGTLSKGNDIA